MIKAYAIILVAYTIVYNIVLTAQGDYYGTYSTYDNICFKRNLFAWLPVIASVVIFLWAILFSDSFDITAKSLLLIFGAWVSSIICLIHSHSKNIDTGTSMHMQNTKRYHYEEKEETMGKVSTIASTAYIAHSIKEGVKDVTDVDNWKEMK